MALSAFISCQTIETEVPAAEDLQKVEMTFNASFDLSDALAADTKVAVGEIDTENKALKLTWKAGDKIAVFDDKSSGPNEFVASSDGDKVSFTGTVTAGATQFIAIYPYSAAKSVDVATGACEIDFPQDQHAVAGSFDPEALVTVGSATSENPSIRFRLIGSLMSFSVDFDDVVFVEFSGSRPMSGDVTFTNAVEATGPTSVATGTPNYKSVTLSNADGSPLKKGETYYVSVRHTGSNSQEGFTAKLITAGAQVASRVASNPFQIARKTLYPLGTFTSSNVNFAYDRKDLQQSHGRRCHSACRRRGFQDFQHVRPYLPGCFRQRHQHLRSKNHLGRGPCQQRPGSSRDLYWHPQQIVRPGVRLPCL